eukprot:1155069_1
MRVKTRALILLRLSHVQINLESTRFLFLFTVQNPCKRRMALMSLILCIITTTYASRWHSSSSQSWYMSKDMSSESMEWGKKHSHRRRWHPKHSRPKRKTPSPIIPNHDTNAQDDCSDQCTDNTNMPNFCDYASDLWDDADTPLEDRNNIGMAKYLSSSHTLKAVGLAKLGKVYKLSYEYTNSMPAFGTRAWYTSLRNPGGGPFGVVSAYYKYDQNNNTQCGVGWGYLDQRLMTSASGNSGTQFDGLGHVFYMNGEFGDQRNYLFFNGFTGTNVLQEHGVKYIGIEQLPPLITRAILIDVAGYVGYDPLPDDFEIDTEIVMDTLRHQQMNVDDIEEGDAVLFYTGWVNANWEGDPAFYYSRSPGITLDTVVKIFGPKKVLLLGADNWAVEYAAFGEPLAIPVHMHWIICHGGFLYENLKLVEWAQDARKGEVPYLGGFYYVPAQIQGGVGGLATPMVIV